MAGIDPGTEPAQQVERRQGPGRAREEDPGATGVRSGRRSTDRSGGRRRGDPLPLPIDTHSLDVLVDGLEQFAAAMPPGLELFTAIYDIGAGASDLVIRAPDGDTRFVLGLPDEQHERLGALLDWVRGDFEPEPDEETGAEPGDDPEPGAATSAEALTAPAAATASSEPQLDPAVDDLLYRTLIEQSPVSLVVVRRDGVIEFASPAVATGLGMSSPAELIGTPFTDLVHVEDRDRMSPLATPAAGRSPGTRLLSADGLFRSVDITARNLSGEGRMLLALQLSPEVSDVDVVAAVERRQRALADASDAGTALINAGAPGFGCVLVGNAAFSRLTGLMADELVGEAACDLFVKEDAGRIFDALRRAADGEGSSTLNVRLASELHRRVELFVSLSRAAGQAPAQLAIRIREIGSGDGSVGELQARVARLEAQNAELANLTRTTAYGLMSPLRAVSGLVDMLVPSVGGEASQALAAVQSAVGRMLSMLDGSVGFAGALTASNQRELVDLNAIVEYVTASLATEIAASRAVVRSSELPVVTGDLAQLERVLQSLLANAIAAAVDGPPVIDVSAELYGDMWRIRVADQGSEIDPEARERIFELFEPVPRVTDDSPRAAGIGLAACRRIIEQHGGHMWVEANEPRGAAFFFTVPADT